MGETTALIDYAVVSLCDAGTAVCYLKAHTDVLLSHLVTSKGEQRWIKKDTRFAPIFHKCCAKRPTLLLLSLISLIALLFTVCALL